jgi:hypothetical protein
MIANGLESSASESGSSLISARPAGRCVVSVPWEPWLRLGNLGRGKNLRRLGNDPAHIGFLTPQRLHRVLTTHFEQVRVEGAFPWLVADARRPREQSTDHEY